MVVDHLSRLEYLKPDLVPIKDYLIYDRLIASVDSMISHDEDLEHLELHIETTLVMTTTPWYADFVNYLVVNILPPHLTYQQKKKLFHDIKEFYWDEPLLFKRGTYDIFRHCVPGEEVDDIITHCPSAPYGGHASTSKTCAKILQAGLYWPTLWRDIHAYIIKCDMCQCT